MAEDNAFWEFYWETRLQPMETLGKRAAILAASRWIRTRAAQLNRPLRLLELGCGTGQVIGALLDAHTQVCALQDSVGVDYNEQSLAICRREHPGMRCIQADFTDPTLLDSLGRFDLVLLVNALHEVFSASTGQDTSRVEFSTGYARVAQAFSGAAGRVLPGGRLLLFDGLEPPGEANHSVRIRFRSVRDRNDFETFAREYRPVEIRFFQTRDPLCVDLPQRAFTRYITKSIFLGKLLWESERLESYQYFTEDQFRAAFAGAGMEIIDLQTLTMNEAKWRQKVEILTPGTAFPQEHVMILAKNGQPGGV